MKHPNWDAALTVLELMLPGSLSYELDDLRLDQSPNWEPLPVDDRPPDEVEADLLLYCSERLTGLLIVVTTASWQRGGPLFVRAERVEWLMDVHPECFGMAFVDIDVVLAAPADGTVVIVHHNGLVATLHGRAVEAWPAPA